MLEKNEVIIDMTNFIGMGTILYECLKPLNNVVKLTFVANKNAIKHIEAMGFDRNIISLVE